MNSLLSNKILPKNYLTFQWLFSSRGHEDLTKSFLEDMLGRNDIKGVDFRNPYDLKTIKKQYEKNESIWTYTIADVIAKQDDGTVNLIEMQRYYHDYMPERFLAELASKYGDQAHVGKTMSEKYSGYNSIVGLILLDEVELNKRIKHDKVVERFALTELEDHYLYPADSSIFINVVKLKEEEELKRKYREIYYWVHFLNTCEVLEGSQDGVMEAYQMLKAKKWSDEELEIQRVAEKAEAIGYGIKAFERREGREEGLKKGIQKGREEGLKKGIEKGKKEGKYQQSLKIAKNLLTSSALTLKQIATMTDLSLEQLKSEFDS